MPARGSPSTPFALSAHTPDRTSSAVDGIGPGSARSSWTRSGRTASISDVSVCPACGSPPATRGHQARTRRPSASSCSTAAIDGGRVAAVAVDQHDGLCPVGRPDQLDDHVVHRLVADRQRAGEPLVLAARRDRHGRRDDAVGALAARSAGQRLGDDRIGGEREVRAVLLARADRHDDDVRAVDLRPAHVTQVHAVTVPNGCRGVPIVRGRRAGIWDDCVP